MLNKKSRLKLCIYTRNKASDKYSFPRENGYFFHYSTGNAEEYPVLLIYRVFCVIIFSGSRKAPCYGIFRPFPGKSVSENTFMKTIFHKRSEIVVIIMSIYLSDYSVLKKIAKFRLTDITNHLLDLLLKCYISPGNIQSEQWKMEIARGLNEILRLKHRNKYPSAKEIYLWTYDIFRDLVTDIKWFTAFSTEICRSLEIKPPEDPEECMTGFDDLCHRYFRWIAENLSKNGCIQYEDIYSKIDELLSHSDINTDTAQEINPLKDLVTVSYAPQEPFAGTVPIGKSDDSDDIEYCVCINSNPIRYYRPYLKFYNAKEFYRAEKVIRLGLKQPEVVLQTDELEFWNVTKNELRLLDKFLAQKSKIFSVYSNWQTALFIWNSENLFFTDFPKEYPSITDAYFDGFYDTEENLKKPHYLPSFQKQIFYADEITK